MAKTNEKLEQTPKSDNRNLVSKIENKPVPTPKPSNGTIRTNAEEESNIKTIQMDFDDTIPN